MSRHPTHAKGHMQTHRLSWRGLRLSAEWSSHGQHPHGADTEVKGKVFAGRVQGFPKSTKCNSRKQGHQHSQPARSPSSSWGQATVRQRTQTLRLESWFPGAMPLNAQLDEQTNLFWCWRFGISGLSFLLQDLGRYLSHTHVQAVLKRWSLNTVTHLWPITFLTCTF